MAKKPYEELSKLLSENMKQVSLMKVRSASAERRSRLYLQMLLIAIKYPRTIPEDLAAKLATLLLKFDEDDDVQFIRKHFPEFEAFIQADDEHAVQHAERPLIPDALKKKV